MGIIIGIDGGGSRTRVLAVDDTGSFLGFAEGGPANCQTVGKYQAGREIGRVVEKVLDNRGKDEVELICAGLAGTGRDKDRAEMKRILAGYFGKGKVKVETDAWIALAGGTICRPGVVVVAGTGSIALGTDEAGNRARSGGWGYLLGDEGSAYAVGREGINAALRSFDGRGQDTRLLSALMEYFGLEARQKNCKGKIYRVAELVYGCPGDERSVITGFARLVLREAERGDRTAGVILERAGRELVLMAVAVLRKLNLSPATGRVVTTGGLFSTSFLTEIFTRRLKESAPEYLVEKPAFEPVVGAVLLGLRKVNHGLTEKILLRLRKELPERLCHTGGGKIGP